MKTIRDIIFLLLLTALSLTSCNRQVQRIEADSTVDISGRWNDTDARITAQELITEVMGQPWLNDHLNLTGEKPVVICGLVENKSHEHIEAEIFVKELEKAFIKSGRVRVVQGGNMRSQIRTERADQQLNSTKKTMNRWGMEIGADYILQGVINSIVDAEGKKKVVFYQIDMELTNIETNEIVWIGDKKIKKFIKR